MPSVNDFARDLRNRFPTTAQKYPDDQQLVTRWLQLHPEDKPKVETNPVSVDKPDTGFSPVALGLRVIPAAVTSVGGWPGAAGAGAGEVLAQGYEYLRQGQPFRPGQIAAQAAIGAIPFSGAKAGLTAGKALLGQAAKGAALGAASTALTKVGEGEVPSVKDLALGTAGGAVLGAGTQALTRKLSGLPLGELGKRVEQATATKADELTAKLPRQRGLRFVDTEGLRPSAPPQQAIPPSRLFEFPSLQKMPKEIQQDIQNVLEEHGGFAAQRRGVQPNERTKILAERLTVPLQQLKPGTMLKPEELVAYRDALASVMDQRHDYAQKITAGTATDLDKLAFAKLTSDATVLMSSYRGAKTEAGRALQILKTEARLLDVGDTAFIAKLMKTPGVGDSIDRLVALTAQAGDDPIKQLEILKNQTGTVFDKMQSLYYNSLLSGVKTHFRNTIGNTFNLLANLVTPIVGSPVDILRHAITGQQREVFLGEVGPQLVGLWNAIPQAFSKAIFTLKHGFTPGAVTDLMESGKFDTNVRAEFPGGAITNWPTRLLEASDQFFRTLAHNQELYGSAYAAARQKGLTHPAQFSEFMAKAMTNPNLIEGAERFAKRAVFQEKAGPIVQTILNLKGNPNLPLPLRTALTFIAPFVRTPANIIRQGLETSPVGFMMNQVKQGGRAGVQGMSRATLGSLILAPMAWLAANGKLSGNGPSDPGERAALYEKGWMPNSVKVGDTWVRYQLFQPFSVPLAAVANAFEKFQQSDRSDNAAEESLFQAIAGAGSSLADQSFLAGLNGFLDMINDPERSSAQFLALTAQGMVPGSGLLRNITQGVDPTIRKPEGVKEAVESIIPGMSQNVLPRRDRFGEEVKRPGGPLRRGFIVPEISEETQRPEAAFLEQRGLTPQVPRARLEKKGKKFPVSREQADTIEQAIGQDRLQAIRRMLGSKTPPYRVESKLADVTRKVNQRAIRTLGQNKPLEVDKLRRRKSSVDDAYQIYLKQNGGG